jgi:hypothetical protein
MPGTCPGNRIRGSRRWCRPWAGSIRAYFHRAIGRKPTKKALSFVRGLFPFIHPVTREERRDWESMMDAFEPYAEQIRQCLNDPSFLQTVIVHLCGHTDRRTDLEASLVWASNFLPSQIQP